MSRVDQTTAWCSAALWLCICRTSLRHSLPYTKVVLPTDAASRVAASSAESLQVRDGINGLFTYHSLPNSTKVVVRDLHVREDNLLQRAYCCAAAGILKQGTGELLKLSHLQARGMARLCVGFCSKSCSATATQSLLQSL